MKPSIASVGRPPSGRARAVSRLAALLLAASVLGPAAAQTLPPPTSEPLPGAGGRSDPRRAATLLEQVRRLVAERQYQLAITEAAKAGDKNPNHVELAFLSAVALARLGRTDEAIDAFEKLTRQYPELGEPYNNLAVLYASRDELNRAREALEQAIRVEPGYGIAHENLGDILLRLARREYERAAKTASSHESASRKLEMTTELIDRLAPTAGKAPARQSP